MKKNILLLFLLGLFTLCFTYAQNRAMPSGYNASAQYTVQGAWEFYLKGSFLYWQPKEKGLEAGILSSTSSGHQDRVQNLNFDYKPGFKVTVGTNFEHDKWSLEAEYTRFHSTEDRHFYASSPEYIIPSWHEGIVAFVNNAKVKWKLLYDTIDLHLLRADYSGKAITLSPFLGARAGWIKQKLHARYHTTQNIYAKARSSSWFIGPRIGVTARYFLGYGIHILGDVGGCLSYQDFTTYLKQDDPTTPTTVFFDIKDHTPTILPNTNVGLGLGWSKYFDRDNWHIVLLLKYENNYYFNQNTMRHLKDSTSSSLEGGNTSDLSLQGLTATVRIDF